MALITFFFKNKKEHLESTFETGLGYKINLVFWIVATRGTWPTCVYGCVWLAEPQRTPQQPHFTTFQGETRNSWVWDTQTRRPVTLALGSCLSTINRHVRTGNAQATHTCSLLRARTCTKKHSEKKSGVITGAEKAMCLQWQVHSGVSSVPFAGLENNITGFSSV